MINILFVSTYLARNGTEAFMMNVFRNIDKSRYHIDFLCFSREAIAYENEIINSGSSVFVLPQRKEGLSYYMALKEFFREHAKKYNVLHWCACSCTSVAPLLFATIYKIPIRISHSHNSSVVGFHNKLFHILLRPIAYFLANKRLACSDKASKWFFHKRKSIILTNGIQLSHFSYNQSTRFKVRASFGITETTTIIGHVGRFDPVKNHARLLDIFISCLRYKKDARLMLIGIGALEKNIKDRVSELGLEEKVLFLGERDDVPLLMQAMDCFVMPSLFEGLPFVLIEAQASGLPCIVSNTVDVHAKMTDIFSFLDLEASSDEWAKQIIKTTTLQRGDTSNYIIEAGFSIEQTIKSLEKVYDGNDFRDS